MPETRSYLVIFSPALVSLGEITFEHGAGVEVFLNAQGEKVLSQWFEEWQTQGILHSETETQKAGKDHTEFITAHRTQMRSSDFENILRIWLNEHKYHSLTLSPTALTAWHVLCDMDLHPAERYMLGAGLRHLPKNEIASWEMSLAKIAKENQAAQSHTDKKIFKHQKVKL